MLLARAGRSLAHLHRSSSLRSVVPAAAAAGSKQHMTSSSTSSGQVHQPHPDAQPGVKLWEPHDKAGTNMTAFSAFASQRTGKDLSEWHALHQWSVTDLDAFWRATTDFVGIRWSQRPTGRAYTPPPPGRMRGARWFEGGTLNFAENLLPRRDSPHLDREVLICVAEGYGCNSSGGGGGAPSPALPARRITGRQLWHEVAACARALRAAGVGRGDVVAGVLPNGAEVAACALGAAAVGAAWSSCSPDFGVAGVVDRLGQVAPKVIFFTDGYYYGGRRHDCLSHIAPIVDGVTRGSNGGGGGDGVGGGAGAPLAVVTPYWGGRDPAAPPPPRAPAGAVLYSDFIGDSSSAASGNSPNGNDIAAGGNVGTSPPPPLPELEFAPLPFDHPLFIMFSSGTTGLPKCMVHGAGGTLLNQKKELALHCDVRAGDRMLYYTTTGWMMWNWLLGALSVEGASIVAYDGSPAYPETAALFHAAAALGVTHLGASPKYYGACAAAGVSPAALCSGGDGGGDGGGGLGRLRALLSTGSPLLPSHYEWAYGSVKRDMHLASISGGTDILGCFMLGNPNLPVHSGEIQCAGLGMDVRAWDDGVRAAVEGAKGELVCAAPFPSMPVHFLNDPDGTRYRDAYFAAGEGLWRHGDFIEVTLPRRGLVVHGRSDATLNPGGVRIGTAEIYRQVEGMPQVADSLAIGRRAAGGDVDVVLFVKMAPGHALDAALVKHIKATIRTRLTPRHVPAEVVAVGDVPYTRSGKKVEIAATRAVHGDKVDNASALANPDCLNEYRRLGAAWRGGGDSRL